MRIPTVQNMMSAKGTYNTVANQFLIEYNKGKSNYKVFQSYRTIIAVKETTQHGQEYITLDRNSWDYSVTTGRYRNIFLGENTAETRKNIKSGKYALTDLNK